MTTTTIMRIGVSALAVCAVNTAANSFFWQSVHPQGAGYSGGYPTAWWLGLFAVPVLVAYTLGWIAAGLRSFGFVLVPIVLGLVLQALVTTLLNLPGHDRAPVSLRAAVSLGL